ncbi:hypothetical protein HRbin27_01894 [bacterium HR27]|nr:hypothetical protein HRbin27_01894 [bacterium HR27]
MVIVVELDSRLLQFPVPLYPDLFRTVHHDFSDGVIFQEWFDRTVTENLRDDRLEQAMPLDATENDSFRLENREKRFLQRAADTFRIAQVHPWIEFGDHTVLHATLELMEGIVRSRRGRSPERRTLQRLCELWTPNLTATLSLSVCW